MGVDVKIDMFRRVISTQMTYGKLPRRCLMSTDICNTSFENGVKKITMTSPKTRNSLSLEMLTRLEQEIHGEKNNQQLRSIVLTGEGPAFSAGHNLKEMTFKEGKKYHEEIFQK